MKLSIKTICLSILLSVWAVIALTNLSPGTFFSSWDNLHPEFNIPLNITRALHGVWQGHQGVGHVGGHGYAATLPHTLAIGMLSIILPESLVRSAFTLLMLLAGALGMYVLGTFLFKETNEKLRHPLALMGALFYTLNLSTIQQFYVQLEAFIIHFAALPWLLYLMMSLLEKWNKKTLIIFAVVSLITTTQGFIPSLFIAYMVLVTIIALFYVLEQRSFSALKKSAAIIVLTILINAYWLFPALHYTFTGASVFLNANNNLLSTQSWIDTNNKYGSITDLPLLRGFPWQAIDELTPQGARYIFQPWQDHFRHLFVSVIGYFFFGVIVLGVTNFIKISKKKYTLGIILFFLIMFSILAAEIPVFSLASALIQKLPVIRQAFRAGFTKLSISLALCYSIFFMYGIHALLFKVRDSSISAIASKIRTGVFIVFAALLIIFSFPVFRGHLFYQKAHLKIPQAYFQMFDFFKTQPADDKIMLLPQGSHWGWDTYKWGYTGSGFLWFGLQQSIFERAFDVWSQYNENYYWELTYALYSKNQVLLESLIDKYQIGWIVFDESLVPYIGKYPFTTEELYKNLAASPKLELAQTFGVTGKNHLYIFKTKFAHTSKNNIDVVSSLPAKPNGFEWLHFDKTFQTVGTYYDNGADSSIYFPWDTLFSYRKQEEKMFSVKEDADSITFSTQLPEMKNSQLIIPPNDPDSASYTPTHVEIKNKTLEVQLPKLNKYASYDSNVPGIILPEVKKCDQGKGENSTIASRISNKTIYTLENTDSSTCYDLFISNLPHKFGYLVGIESQNIQGDPLTLLLINGTTRRSDIELHLPSNKGLLQTSYIVVPPYSPYGLGYSFRLSNISIGNKKSINKIGRIMVYPIPYDYLTNMSFKKTDFKINTQYESPNTFQVDHINSARYIVDAKNLDSLSEPQIILYQGFDPHWKAYRVAGGNFIQEHFPYFGGHEIKDHVLINNWANGWKLSKTDISNGSNKIVIIFWPQYLEYLGLLLIPLVFGVLIFKKH